MVTLQKTESRLPAVFPEQTPQGINFFNGHNASLLGFNHFDGNFCLVSYMPSKVRIVKVFENFQNHYMAFIKSQNRLKVTEETKGHLQILLVKPLLDYDGKIEYLLIQINGKTFYSFGLELFAEKKLQLPEELIQEILDHIQLNVEDSMRYGKYLKNKK